MNPKLIERSCRDGVVDLLVPASVFSINLAKRFCFEFLAHHHNLQHLSAKKSHAVTYRCQGPAFGGHYAEPFQFPARLIRSSCPLFAPGKVHDKTTYLATQDA